MGQGLLEDFVTLHPSQRTKGSANCLLVGCTRPLEIRELFNELPVDRKYLLGACPLKHDLRDEDPVRIARLPPRICAPMFLEPLEQAACETALNTRSCCHRSTPGGKSLR